MSPERVWSRFEKKGKDGAILKLRIQDLPPDRVDDATNLMTRYFVKEEPLCRAVGISRNPVTEKKFAEYVRGLLLQENSSGIICCHDDTDEVRDIIGLSIMHISDEFSSILELVPIAESAPDEWQTYKDININLSLHYNPMKEHNLSFFYEDFGLFVVPEYRGLGIATEFFNARRLVCEVEGVPLTGAWTTSAGTQIAAKRAGWETVSEIKFEPLAKKHGVTFTDVPPTMKYVEARVRIPTEKMK